MSTRYQTPARVSPETMRGWEIINHAASAVIYRLKEDGIVEFLLFDYMTRKKNVLCCAGGDQDYPQENPAETAEREIEEEMMQKGTTFRMEADDEPLIHSELVPSENPPGGLHAKIFFSTQIHDYELRKETYTDTSGLYPEKHGIPKWMDAGEALLEMTLPNRGKPAHTSAVKKCLARLMDLHMEVGRLYMNLASRLEMDFDVEPIDPRLTEYLATF